MAQVQKMDQQLPVVILAAGRGSRLGRLTDSQPKCLLPIGPHPILFYQLRALEASGFRRLLVVTGYRRNAIKKYVKKAFPALNVRFAHNPLYRKTDDLYSFYLARDFSRNGVIQINSDVVFTPKTLQALAAQSGSAICLRRGACGKEELKVITKKETNRVLMLSKALPPRDADGESMGLHLFSKAFARDLFNVAKELLRRNLNETRATAITEVLKRGKTLSYVDVTTHPVMEVDFPKDIRAARRMIAPYIV